jgi:hypothetical protein
MKRNLLKFGKKMIRITICQTERRKDVQFNSPAREKKSW